MTDNDLKVYLFNGFTLGVSVSDVEMALKIILLLASIGYTFQRWWVLRKEQQNKD